MSCDHLHDTKSVSHQERSKMTKPAKEKIWRSQIRLPKQLMDALKRRADSNFRTLNSEIVEIIRTTVKNEPMQNADH